MYIIYVLIYRCKITQHVEIEFSNLFKKKKKKLWDDDTVKTKQHFPVLY